MVVIVVEGWDMKCDKGWGGGGGGEEDALISKHLSPMRHQDIPLTDMRICYMLHNGHEGRVRTGYRIIS